MKGQLQKNRKSQVFADALSKYDSLATEPVTSADRKRPKNHREALNSYLISCMLLFEKRFPVFQDLFFYGLQDVLAKILRSFTLS